MEVCELIKLLKKYPEDMDVYLSVDGSNGVCRSVVEDMDYCVFLCDEYEEEYSIGLTDDLQLVKWKNI
jgi:hypothetical protein